jgi:hypothetical protein
MTTMTGTDTDTSSDTTVVAGGSTDTASDSGGKISPGSGPGAASFVTVVDTMCGSFTTAVDDVAPKDGWTTVGKGGEKGR